MGKRRKLGYWHLKANEFKVLKMQRPDDCRKTASALTVARLMRKLPLQVRKAKAAFMTTVLVACMPPMKEWPFFHVHSFFAPRLGHYNRMPLFLFFMENGMSPLQWLEFCKIPGMMDKASTAHDYLGMLRRYRQGVIEKHDTEKLPYVWSFQMQRNVYPDNTIKGIDTRSCFIDTERKERYYVKSSKSAWDEAERQFGYFAKALN